MKALLNMELLLMVTTLATSWHLGDPAKPSFNFSQHVANVSYFFFTVDLEQTKYLTLSYDITFSEESCCPVLAVKPEDLEHYHLSEDNCLEKDFSNIATLSAFHIPMPNNIYQSGCRKAGSKYICKGIWKFFRPDAIEWTGYLLYSCSQKKNLDITLNLTFYIAKPQACEPLKSKICGDRFGYNKTIFPNIVNLQSQKDMLWVEQVGVTFFRKNLGICYQHFTKLLCFSFFPNCVNGVQYVPCRQMCLEAKEGCSDVIKRFSQPVYCEVFPDSMDPDVCLYEPVFCNIPDDLEFGTVTYEGRNPFNITSYVCNPGYRLEGETQRVCLYSGMWNGSTPICVEIVETDLTILLVSTITTITSIIILLSVTAACVWKRRDIKILIWDIANRGHYEVNEERKKKLFLTYSTMDNPVVDIILPELKREIPAWDITTFQQDFQGGKTILGSIHDGVWKSDAMLALLTENYVQSEWCQYEFTQAKTRSATDLDFRCIIILQEGTDAEFVGNLPRPFQDYAKSRIYLTYGEVLFWRKLRRALHALAAKAGP